MQKIFVIEDDENIRNLVKIALEGYGYQVLAFETAEEALELVGKEQPDLAVFDLMLPGMDGLSAIRLIRNRDDEIKNIPIIVLTAKDKEYDKVVGLDGGADDYVTKPFNMTILVLRIRKLIELSRYHRVTQGMIDPAPSEIVITSLDEKLIEKAIKYVEDNMSRTELSVEELSRELGMSRVHLYKKLLQITGKTPIEFIRVIRLKRAAQLLRESQLHVSEVAFEVGLNNPKYFSRYFKDEFGVLPSVYQEKEGK